MYDQMLYSYCFVARGQENNPGNIVLDPTFRKLATLSHQGVEAKSIYNNGFYTLLNLETTVQ